VAAGSEGPGSEGLGFVGEPRDSIPGLAGVGVAKGMGAALERRAARSRMREVFPEPGSPARREIFPRGMRFCQSHWRGLGWMVEKTVAGKKDEVAIEDMISPPSF
jgi:hypothetical protein